MTTRSTREPVTVRTCRTLQEAQLVRSMLEAGGVEAFIPDENVAGLLVPDALDTDGVRVQVAAEDADVARELLEREAD
jgi:putative signal transducing protein